MEKVCYWVSFPGKTYSTNKRDKALRDFNKGARVTEIREFVWVSGRCRYEHRVTVQW